jgi:hypothetical protein
MQRAYSAFQITACVTGQAVVRLTLMLRIVHGKRVDLLDPGQF